MRWSLRIARQYFSFCLKRRTKNVRTAGNLTQKQVVKMTLQLLCVRRNIPWYPLHQKVGSPRDCEYRGSPKRVPSEHKSTGLPIQQLALNI